MSTARIVASVVAAALLFLPACESGSDDASSSTTTGAGPSSTTNDASTTSTTAAGAIVLSPEGLGPLKLGMTTAAAQATGLIGPVGEGCEFAGTRDAALLAPLEGAVTFGDDDLVQAVDVDSGASTAEGLAPDASIDQIEAAYDGHNGFTLARDDTPLDVFGLFLLNVSRGGDEVYGFVFNEGNTRARGVAAPNVQFCD